MTTRELKPNKTEKPKDEERESCVTCRYFLDITEEDDEDESDENEDAE